MKLHDDHYRNKVIEPIMVQEQVMLDLTSVPADRRHFLAQAIRYIMRAGTKADNPWEKDIEKALNYLNRTLTGKWWDE